MDVLGLHHRTASCDGMDVDDDSVSAAVAMPQWPRSKRRRTAVHAADDVVPCPSVLLDLPLEIWGEIVSFLPWRDAVKVVSINHPVLSAIRGGGLSRQKIGEIGRTRTGKDALAVVRFIGSLQPEWQSSVGWLASRKMRNIAIHDYPVLAHAWQCRRNAMTHYREEEAFLTKMYTPLPEHFGRNINREKDIDLLHIGPARVPASFYELKSLSLPCQLLVLEDFVRHGAPRCLSLEAIYPSLKDVGADFSRCSPTLLKSMASALFRKYGMCRSDVAALFNMSEALVTELLDPVIAENIIVKRRARPWVGERWHPGDVAFHRLVCDGALHHFAGDLRVDHFDNRSAHSSADFVAMLTMMLDRLMPVELGAATFLRLQDTEGAVPALRALYDRIVRGDLKDEWAQLCDDVRRQSWEAWPMLMFQLAIRNPFQDESREVRLAEYEKFSAWRDAVVEKCRTPMYMTFAARACAAVLEFWRPADLDEVDWHDTADGDDIAWITALVTREAACDFDAIPPALWQPLLEALEDRPSMDYPYFSRRLYLERLALFCRDPNASIVMPYLVFDKSVRDMVVDQRYPLDHTKSEKTFALADLCHRFNWPADALKESILALGLGEVRYGTDGLKRLLSTLRFDNADLACAIENKLFKYCLALNREGDPVAVSKALSNALDKLSRSSAYLSALVRIYQAGTTEEVHFEVDV